MMTTTTRVSWRFCCACSLVWLVACGGNGPTSPTETTVSVAGTWDVIFNGTVVQRNDGGPLGTPQSGVWVYEFQQSGSSVTGSLVGNEGRPDEARLPMTGTVTGNTFTYRLDATISGCAVSFTGDTTVNSAGDRFTGTQTQANCEGTAQGQVTGTRR